jgi:hypothetical protein
MPAIKRIEGGIEYQCTCGKTLQMLLAPGERPDRLVKCWDCVGKENEKFEEFMEAFLI